MNKYNDINIHGYDTLTDGRDPLPPSFIHKNYGSTLVYCMNAEKSTKSKRNLLLFKFEIIYNYVDTHKRNREFDGYEVF